jgi:hypothetical protein
MVIGTGFDPGTTACIETTDEGCVSIGHTYSRGEKVGALVGFGVAMAIDITLLARPAIVPTATPMRGGAVVGIASTF